MLFCIVTCNSVVGLMTLGMSLCVSKCCTLWQILTAIYLALSIRRRKSWISTETTDLRFTTIEHPVLYKLRGLSVEVLVQSVVKKTDAYLHSVEHLRSLRWLSTIIICTHIFFEDMRWIICKISCRWRLRSWEDWKIPGCLERFQFASTASSKWKMNQTS